MRLKITAMAALAATVLGACADNRPPEEIVADRAQARWDALVSRKFEVAWKYYSPGYRERRGLSTFIQEMAKRPVKWENSIVKSVSCEDFRCRVMVSVTYSAIGAPGALAGISVDREIGETWIRSDADWWLVPEN